MIAITLHQAVDTKAPCTCKSMDAHAFSSLIPIIPTELVLKLELRKFVVHHNIPLVSNDLLAPVVVHLYFNLTHINRLY